MSPTNAWSSLVTHPFWVPVLWGLTASSGGLWCQFGGVLSAWNLQFCRFVRFLLELLQSLDQGALSAVRVTFKTRLVCPGSRDGRRGVRPACRHRLRCLFRRGWGLGWWWCHLGQWWWRGGCDGSVVLHISASTATPVSPASPTPSSVSSDGSVVDSDCTTSPRRRRDPLSVLVLASSRILSLCFVLLSYLENLASVLGSPGCYSLLFLCAVS